VKQQMQSTSINYAGEAADAEHQRQLLVKQQMQSASINYTCESP
jgi:hypothetical protein